MPRRSRRSEPPLHPALTEFARGLGRLLANALLANRTGLTPVASRVAQADADPPAATDGAKLTIKTPWGFNSTHREGVRYG